jgi:hypothetical protein
VSETPAVAAAPVHDQRQVQHLGLEIGKGHREQTSKGVASNIHATFTLHHLLYEEGKLSHPRVDAVLQSETGLHRCEGPGCPLSQQIDRPDPVVLG